MKMRTSYILAILIFSFSCGKKTTTSYNQSTKVVLGEPIDTIVIETFTAKIVNFTTEIWCNEALQAGQKNIISAEYSL